MCGGRVVEQIILAVLVWQEVYHSDRPLSTLVANDEPKVDGQATQVGPNAARV